MKVNILAINILYRKIAMLLIILFFFIGCNISREKSEENNKIKKFTWMEFGWLANDSGEVTSLNIIRYLEVKNDSTALIASKESFDGNLIYKQVSLNDSISSKIADFISYKMDSSYMYESGIDSFLYCGYWFYLNFKKSEKDSTSVMFIPPKAPENLKSLKLIIEALIESPHSKLIKEFPIHDRYNEFRTDYGDRLDPPKIATTRFLPPKIMEDENQ